MSDRALTTNLNNALTAPVVRPLVLLFCDFATGPVRIWNGYGTLTWSANNWSGIGGMGSITGLEEAMDLSARGVTFQLSGVDPDLIVYTLTDEYQGRECALYLGAVDDSGLVVLDPYRVFRGRMDVMQLTREETTATIQLNAENRLIDMQRSRETRYDDGEQQFRFPGDRGFEYVPSIQNKQLMWGIGPKNTVPNIGGGISSDSGGGLYIGGGRSPGSELGGIGQINIPRHPQDQLPH